MFTRLHALCGLHTGLQKPNANKVWGLNRVWGCASPMTTSPKGHGRIIMEDNMEEAPHVMQAYVFFSVDCLTLFDFGRWVLMVHNAPSHEDKHLARD